MTSLDWIWDNRTWVFSGIGVAIVCGIVALFRRRDRDVVSQHQRSGHGSATIQVAGDLHAGDIALSAGSTTDNAGRLQTQALREIVGKIAPTIEVIMNAASSPRDPAALRSEMKAQHERLDELSALFVSEPDTLRAITMLGQVGGGAVSMGSDMRPDLFDMYREAVATVTAALRTRSS